VYILLLKLVSKELKNRQKLILKEALCMENFEEAVKMVFKFFNFLAKFLVGILFKRIILTIFLYA
jgi:hypothetical protein